MVLSTRTPRRIVFGGRRIKIKPYFWRVLRCNEVMTDALLSDADKIDVCLRLLVGRRKSWRFRRDKQRLLEALFAFLARGKKEEGEKLFDFVQDADYIYSAFLQTYGLDLLGKSGANLHWWTFTALLYGLPDDTRLMQIVDIRARPLPKPTKYNVDERQQLMRLKALYRLDASEGERRKQFADGLRNIAVMLSNMAKDGD